MSRTVKITLAIVVLLAILAGVFWFFYIYGGKDGDAPRELRSLFSFGLENTDDIPRGPSEDDAAKSDGEGDGVAPKVLPKLYQIHDAPVAGVGVFLRNDSVSNASAIVRFIERAGGHVYEFDTAVVAKQRISNETLGTVYRALWDNAGNTVFAQYLDEEAGILSGSTVQTFELALGTAGIERTEALPDHIVEWALREDTGNRLFYLLPANQGGVSGRVRNTEGGVDSEIFSSPVTEWVAQWPNEKTVVLTTKPSARIPGISYTVSPLGGAPAKLLGGVKGLSILASSDGSRVAYAESLAGGFVSRLYNTNDKRVSDLPLRTLPEKCVWGKRDPAMLYCAVPRQITAGEYPDVWYQGLVSFSDDIWKINTADGTSEQVAALKDLLKDLGQKEIDAVQLALSPDENLLVFVNKKDLGLWVLRLDGAAEEAPSVETPPGS